MTRQHFQAIASAIWHSTIGHDARKQVAESMASELRQFNGRFDRDKFIAACLDGS